MFFSVCVTCVPLEVSRYGDLAVDQGLHHPADHLIQRPGHVLTEFTLKTTLNIIPDKQTEERTGEPFQNDVLSTICKQQCK